MISPRTRRNLKKELRRNGLAKLGIVLFVLVIAVAVFAPFIAPNNPRAQHLGQKLLPPLGFSKVVTSSSTELVNGSVQTVTETRKVSATWEYPLGTGPLGRGMFSRIVYGARTSVLVGLLGTGVAAVVGVPVGLAAGYYGGKVDDTLMRAADIMLAFPSLVLAIALVGLFGRASVQIPDPWVALGLAPGNMPSHFVLPGTVVLVVGLVNWVWLARVARGEALSVSESEYVKSARSIGASDLRIIGRHVLPNAITPILVLATIQVAAIILLESSLAYLGFSGTTLSWGFDINQGQQHLANAWWVATFPGLAIVVTVIGVNLIGDWLRDALDPGIEGEGGL
ncbi:ABC transporter permease [Haloarchaeobius amylolyticus]|uniref:ABC transporter permease n=1 Tax=Haloarchaeobius amylolyticus TaxID=1198296 RepID=UPI00226D7A6F|nr:ABC transporter permease [Haloarchaeobius amylolyticus]